MPAQLPAQAAKDRAPYRLSHASRVLWAAVVLIISIFPLRYLQQVALFSAAEGGDTGRVQMLLRLGADPNSVYRPRGSWQVQLPGAQIIGVKNEVSPLLVAARDHNWQTVRLLSDAGADVNFHDLGDTALGFAIEDHNAEVVRDLLRRHADSSSTFLGGRPLVPAAVREGSIDVLKALLDAGADTGVEALCEAVRTNRADMVRLLVTRGAKIDACSYGGYVGGIPAYREGGSNPLMLAVENRNAQMVRLLLTLGASPNVKWTPVDPTKCHPFTPLQTAVQNKQQEIIALLREAGAKQ